MSQGTFITLRCVIKNLYRILRLEIIFIQDYEGIASLSSSSRVAIKKPEMEFSDGLVAKDLALSLLWLRFDSLVQELLHAAGTAKKNQLKLGSVICD